MSEVPSFRHVTPAFRVLSGEGALDALAAEFDRARCRRVVVVCGASMLAHPRVLERIASVLGDRLAGQFGGVKEHSPVPVVQAAADLLADVEADAVLAVGGGSAIVTARAASILLAERRDVRDMCTQWGSDGRLISPRLIAAKLPIWIVPSTPTTAYAKAGSAVRDTSTGERLALYDPKTRAQGVVFDPEVAMSAPVELVRGSALNAMCMSVESFQGSSDPLADALLLHALRELTEFLPRLHDEPDDPSIRLRLMLGALLAGQGSDYVGGGLAQALAHSAGPRSSVSNGVVESILLPHTMRFAEPATPGRLAAVTRAIHDRGFPSVASEDNEARLRSAPDAIDELCRHMAVPRRLRDVGVHQGALDEIAEHALGDWTLTRIPRRAGRSELLTVLQEAW
ncbi:alcohol dehydrogenase [Nocardioides sp. Root1257]|uniref:iron-containing alcohol dehydrogenase family protein n=1 Tax=unclassified Nocardioides TaxID=2615069 RepID=UPI0006F2EEE1|nr:MULTISPECIES: iron-containing alcohol dehydrogenase family protein [unclassified Nocardioides]KQW42654.1 alcohol dehydrogenase [Nocardioides sp. Root1257]KRC39912.1 alcohol dehydrogenase [Nocardioides sp. Root224]